MPSNVNAALPPPPLTVVAVRPALTRRADKVLAGSEGPRSRAHYAYIALETVKVIGLIVAGILLLSG